MKIRIYWKSIINIFEFFWKGKNLDLEFRETLKKIIKIEFHLNDYQPLVYDLSSVRKPLSTGIKWSDGSHATNVSNLFILLFLAI